MPDLVCDLGAVGKEPMIRLLVHRAVNAVGEVVEKFIAGQNIKSKG